MELTEAELARVREAVADAPPLTPERREQLRAILSGCQSAGPVPAPGAKPQTAKGGAADAA